MKWTVSLILIAILLLIANSRFQPIHFYSEIPKGSEETVAILPYLNQKYTYLGEGSQMYAFLSEDKETVLKIFKAHHKRPVSLSRFLKNLGKKDQNQSQQKWRIKFQDTCRRYRMAMADLQEETGLIFLHFCESPLALPVTLHYKSNSEIDLSKHPFVLQKKAIPTKQYLKKHPEAISIMKDFFTHRMEKGYSDPRQSLSSNYGFLDGKLIQIDPGKLEPFEGDVDQEIERIHTKIDHWLAESF